MRGTLTHHQLRESLPRIYCNRCWCANDLWHQFSTFALQCCDGAGAARRLVAECLARGGCGVRQRVYVVLHREGDAPQGAALAGGLRLQLPAHPQRMRCQGIPVRWFQGCTLQHTLVNDATQGAILTDSSRLSTDTIARVADLQQAQALSAGPSPWQRARSSEAGLVSLLVDLPEQRAAVVQAVQGFDAECLRAPPRPYPPARSACST